MNRNGLSDSKCGASIISDEWALTVAYFMCSDMKIAFGEHNPTELDNTGREFSVSKSNYFFKKSILLKTKTFLIIYLFIIIILKELLTQRI
jgi:hypothetical protein